MTDMPSKERIETLRQEIAQIASYDNPTPVNETQEENPLTYGELRALIDAYEQQRESERKAMLRGAAFMREKIAQCVEANPRKAYKECAGRIRAEIKLPKLESVEWTIDKWLDADIAAELERDQ